MSSNEDKSSKLDNYNPRRRPGQATESIVKQNAEDFGTGTVVTTNLPSKDTETMSSSYVNSECNNVIVMLMID